MPFGVLYSPSLALAILQSRLEAAGIPTLCRHFTIDYAASIGVEAYNRIAGGFPRTTSLLGEWIFGHALKPKSRAQQEAYLHYVFGSEEGVGGAAVVPAAGRVEYELRIKSIEQILGLAAGARQFIDYAARDILRHDPQVVCLTSVFEQNLASIALAARLKDLSPSTRIVMGGANCEGTMGRELARCHPFIDLVVSGEGDLLIVPLVAGLLRGERWQAVEALRPFVDLHASAETFLQARMVQTLADQPRPGFDAYFADLSRCPSLAAQLDIQIPVESSRGCWWGEKHHCTFCGLNGATMGFRSKAPEVVVEDVRAYVAKHPGRKLCFVDNIMDRRYFSTVLPELAKLPSSAEIFYEIKSNVTKADVRALRDAGVRHVQPGIESLSDHVLSLMKKGVTTIQNLQLLKWCMEHGVRVDWNLLWGFPGELPADYDAMVRLLPWVSHLEPPGRGSRIRLDRHSPNFRQAKELGWRRVRPYPSYGLVYDDLSAESIGKLAYFFEADHDFDSTIHGYTRELRQSIDVWQRAHPQSVFFHLGYRGSVALIDSRPHLEKREVRVLPELASAIVTLCDRGRPVHFLSAQLPGVEPEQLRRELAELQRQGILWSDGDRFLSLAVSLSTYLESRRSTQLEAGIDRMLAESVHGAKGALPWRSLQRTS